MSIIKIETAFNIELEFEIAAFHKRLSAYILDFIILLLYLISMKFFFYDVLEMRRTTNMGLDILMISIPMLLYSLVTEVMMNGQTLGKKLMAIRVISLDGGEPNLGQFILRWITKFFEWPFLFGYVFLPDYSAVFIYVFMTGLLGIGVVIFITVSPKSQRLGDMAAGTVVVNTKSDMGIHDTVFIDVEPENYIVLFPQVMGLNDNDINTIKSVLTQGKKRRNDEMTARVENKVKEVLDIDSDLEPAAFLEKLLEDYNYLATREGG